jgi:hypothetical protein
MWAKDDLTYIDHCGEEHEGRAQVFQSHLNRAASYFSSLKGTKAIFFLQEVVEHYSPRHGKSSNAEMWQFVHLAVNLLRRNHPDITVWSSGRALSDKLTWEMQEPILADNVHLKHSVYKMEVQLLLNYLFNNDCRRDS